MHTKGKPVVRRRALAWGRRSSGGPLQRGGSACSAGRPWGRAKRQARWVVGLGGRIASNHAQRMLQTVE